MVHLFTKHDTLNEAHIEIWSKFCRMDMEKPAPGVTLATTCIDTSHHAHAQLKHIPYVFPELPHLLPTVPHEDLPTHHVTEVLLAVTNCRQLGTTPFPAVLPPHSPARPTLTSGMISFMCMQRSVGVQLKGW